MKVILKLVQDKVSETKDLYNLGNFFRKLQIHQKIAEKIRRIRKERNISQEELTFKAGLNRAYVGYIERGERKPTVDTLAKLAKALKVKLSEFID